MNTLAGCLLTAALVVLVLCSDLLPWKIVSRSEIDGLRQQLEQAQTVAAKPIAPEKRSGAWMWDPANHNPLDKTTPVGGHH